MPIGRRNMTLRDVRIVDLPSMRVVSSLGFGREPEDQAWKQLLRFAANAGIDPKQKGFRTYGFNNPNPAPGSDNYGYEIWLPVGPDIEAVPPIQINQVPGGKYAVVRFAGLSNIGRMWGELVAWFEDSPYACPPNWCQCLEALQNPLEPDPDKWVFDLYLPIAEGEEPVQGVS
jgi:DNA gyrase inhibitor GyrI